jgi:hypothetical protein
MKTFRIMLGILAIIPLFLLVDQIVFQADYYRDDSLKQIAFLVLGIPILILNLWAWGYPSIIEAYFFDNQSENI